MNIRTTRTLRVGAFFAVAALALAGCTGTATADDETTAPASDAISISDAWVKSAASGMSAAFGEIVNDSDEDVTVVSAESAASSMLELHETLENEAGEMVMREIDGGFVIPAGGSLSLAPGADHLMLMDLAAPLVAGDEAEFTLTFSDDTTFAFTAPVKDYAGANESYEGGDTDMEMGD